MKKYELVGRTPDRIRKVGEGRMQARRQRLILLTYGSECSETWKGVLKGIFVKLSCDSRQPGLHSSLSKMETKREASSASHPCVLHLILHLTFLDARFDGRSRLHSGIKSSIETTVLPRQILHDDSSSSLCLLVIIHYSTRNMSCCNFQAGMSKKVTSTFWPPKMLSLSYPRSEI